MKSVENMSIVLYLFRPIRDGISLPTLFYERSTILRNLFTTKVGRL